MSDIVFWTVISGIVILAIAFFADLYFYSRIDKVFKFKMEIIDIVGNTAKRMIESGCKDDEWMKPYDVFNRVSYKKMKYSFKPLKLESWYTDEKIKIMKGEKYE